MKLEDYLILTQTEPHGGSPRGISFYKNAAGCGRRAVLDAEEKAQQTETGVIGEGSEDVNHFAVGVHYHRLHELAIRGQRADEAWDMSDSAMSPSLVEALRLFRGYMSMWGSVGARFGGRTVATEVSIPATPAGAEAIRAQFGDDLTGRIDAVVDIDNPSAAQVNTGLVIEPGRYLVDFKTASSHSQQHDWTFRFSEQAAAYLHIYNLENPGNPAKGMIFDLIVKHKNLVNKSFGAFLQIAAVDDVPMLRNLVQIGSHNMKDGGKANPTQCISGFQPCRHFKSGKCGRY